VTRRSRGLDARTAKALNALSPSLKALNARPLAAVNAAALRGGWRSVVVPSVTVTEDGVRLVLDALRLVSESNVRGEWEHARRKAWQRGVVRAALATTPAPRPSAARPVRVEITRQAEGVLDLEDNLPVSAKAVRDELAAWMGTGDGPRDPVRWVYAWRTGAPRVEVVVTQAREEADAMSVEFGNMDGLLWPLWRCTRCRAWVSPMDSAWRWASTRYEHACAVTGLPQAGHFPAERFASMADVETRLRAEWSA
jgi:hypothetical protein